MGLIALILGLRFYITGKDVGLTAAHFILLIVTVLFFAVWTVRAFQNPPGKLAGSRSDSPYDQLLKRRDLGSDMPPDKVFQLFVSYKSEDVWLARRITEALLSAGVAVWFAEYAIRLDDRHDFEASIEDGIKRSRFGVLLTNARYSLSPYPQSEARQLLDAQVCGPQYVLQVKCPDETLDSKFPDLECVAPEQIFEYNEDGDFAANLEFLCKHLGVTTPQQVEPDEEAAPSIYHNQFYDYSLDVSGFEPCRETTQSQFTTVLQGETRRGLDLISWNLLVQPRSDLSPRPLPEKGGSMDDRTCFDENMELARRYFQQTSGLCHGVHLVFHGGFSHLGLTYRPKNENAWVRRYSLVFPWKETRQNMEFAFVFYYWGRFSSFCRVTPEMDRLVASLQWEHFD
jgi:hypothetical protein